MVVSLDELDQHRPHGQVLPWRVEGRDSDRQHRSGCHGDGWGTPSCVVGANTCTPVGGLLRCEIQIGQRAREVVRSEEHTSELQSLMRISYAVFCLKKKITKNHTYQLNY